MDIPQDIIDNVIAGVGDDTQLLKKCSLVSSSFLLPCRKQLFSRITLMDNERFQGIYQLLIQNPVITTFVRTIAFSFTGTGNLLDPANSEWMNGTSLLAILRLPFCCLEGFSINVWPEYRSNWSCFSNELKDALLNIIHSSTLKTLFLKGVSEVPITLFFHIVHLTTLKLDSISPYDFAGRNSSSLAPAEAREPHAVVDRCVWCFNSKQEDSKYEIPFINLLLTNSEQGCQIDIYTIPVPSTVP